MINHIEFMTVNPNATEDKKHIIEQYVIKAVKKDGIFFITAQLVGLISMKEDTLPEVGKKLKLKFEVPEFIEGYSERDGSMVVSTEYAFKAKLYNNRYLKHLFNMEVPEPPKMRTYKNPQNVYELTPEWVYNYCSKSFEEMLETHVIAKYRELVNFD